MVRHLGDDREQHFRANMLLGILVTLGCLVLAIILYFVLIAPFQMDAYTRQWALQMLGAVELILLVLTLLLLRGHYHFVNIATVAVATGAVIAAILLTSGVPATPALPMLLVPPVVAFCLLGVRAGSMLAALIPMVMAAQWYVCTKWGVQLPALQSHKNPMLDTVLTSFISYFMVIMIILVYERMNAKLRRERDRERQRLAHLATHDELTGLANRRYFRQRLEEACTRCDRSAQRVAILLIDLDGFKKINDALGHAAGDIMLAEIASRLRALIRRQDLVARLGGDEFAVIVEPFQSRDEIEHLCERLRSSIAQPLPVSGQPHSVGASIGVALYPNDTADVDHVLSYADAAMYAAKRRQDGSVANA
jgi:diguanylate cyclase (GGDEF)-like protein